ncbi:MAG: DUF3135 domain-containing protein [Sulfuricella sp.]|nr:DUF3135 domain-containing protein [Sulfuricella sp.]
MMKNTEPDYRFDFNEWMKLAQEDPAAFAEQRQRVIDAHLARTAPQLKGLQFRIDMECRRAGEALQACERLSSMMWNSFHELESLFDASGAPRPPDPPAKTARIVPFKRRP